VLLLIVPVQTGVFWVWSIFIHENLS